MNVDNIKQFEINKDTLGYLLNNFITTRKLTETLASKVKPEDQIPQSMEDCSPLKWHRAHTTWFFEEVILKKYSLNYHVFNKDYSYLFNSYYETLGKVNKRSNRGYILRPSVDEVTKYRSYVDKYIIDLFKKISPKNIKIFCELIELGIAHEEQHIELIQSDILNLYSKNIIVPVFDKDIKIKKNNCKEEWIHQKGGIIDIGHDNNKFGFDCEGPKHEVLIKPFKISSKLVTNGDWKQFILDKGYQRTDLWLSDGWSLIRNNRINAPLYWEKKENNWLNANFSGKKEVDDDEPVSHINYYEADAYARWCKKRLPTEFEWEYAAKNSITNKNSTILDLFGSVWQWTSSYFMPYPNYKPYRGSLGEYNGKFMSNQIVLRGSSYTTPYNHSRISYRNFYYPHMRWMFSGLRLVENI
ncbi:MAG: Hercynine oxygenase [Alphaproteobacteria bacterium MarineAlpha2_Bin1]|nr:MAG: Hercynine oxygenase [Alphaproteobacteria bacterium MarineAlpha2_Bin1]